MSYNRLNYDDDTYKTNLLSSISPGLYMLDPVGNMCQPCTTYSTNLNSSYNPDGKCDNIIDVDSELLGIKRHRSKCPAKNYLPSAKPFCTPNIVNKECEDFLRPEYTKVSLPPCIGAREVGINRYQWLCKNPQDKALVPFDYQINNRLIVKDNHRPLINAPIDPSASLPPVCNNNISYDWSSRYSNRVSSEDLPLQDWRAQMPAGIQLGHCENIRVL